jgi:hypothetical protein
MAFPAAAEGVVAMLLRERAVGDKEVCYLR